MYYPSTEKVTSATVNRELPFINSIEESKFKAKRAVLDYVLLSRNRAIVMSGGEKDPDKSEKEHDNGTFFNDYNLLERDGIHLSRKGKGIFGNRLANLVWRALN